MNGPGRPVLWVDPGKMTGLAAWLPGNRVFIDEYDFMGAAENLSRACADWRGGLLVGWEDFTIGPDTHKKSADAHHAIEMIGIARWYARFYGCQILPMAKPGDRLAASRQMLERIGWWVPGKDDAQSAAQHLLSWMLRAGCVPDEAMTSIRSTIRE